jgi:hypothetical protein
LARFSPDPNPEIDEPPYDDERNRSSGIEERGSCPPPSLLSWGTKSHPEDVRCCSATSSRNPSLAHTGVSPDGGGGADLVNARSSLSGHCPDQDGDTQSSS